MGEARCRVKFVDVVKICVNTGSFLGSYVRKAQWFTLVGLFIGVTHVKTTFHFLESEILIFFFSSKGNKFIGIIF